MKIFGFTIKKARKWPIPTRGACKYKNLEAKYVIDGQKFMAWKPGVDQAFIALYDIEIYKGKTSFIVAGNKYLGEGKNKPMKREFSIIK